MAADINDKFTEATNGTRPVPTTLTATRAVGATTISCGALTGWPTATAVHFIIYTTDTSGNKIAGSQLDCKGIVSGTTITNIVYKAGTDNGNSVGAIVEAAPTAAWADDVTEGILIHTDQDGTLKAGAVDVTAVIADGIVTKAKLSSALQTTENTGWIPSALPAVSSVSCNGQRSYDITFASTVAALLSPGMRLRTTRTSAAPTQCTTLNGSSQYYSKASPAGTTFTDDFVVSTWLKISAYPTGDVGLVTRWDGTNGWGLFMDSSGRVFLAGYNGGVGNNSRVTSYNTIPLNKWVHVAAQLDMSAFTATTTTSYIMYDGVDTPASVSRTGTNPTSLAQGTGNLNIGALNGASFFGGKLAQTVYYSAKVTQANVKASISQGLTGSETSEVSAYSFNNSINDLNANANNLTANGGVVATTADSPFGGQGDGTISSTLDYAIVTKVTTTVATVQVAEGCTIPTTGGVTSVDMSNIKSPFNMPIERGKWEIVMLNVGNSTATGGAWVNLDGKSLTIPVGAWMVGFTGALDRNNTAASNASATLSTTTSSETDIRFHIQVYSSLNSDLLFPFHTQNSISLSTATPYYVLVNPNGIGAGGVGVKGDGQITKVVAELATL